ncbi:hypothetical protein CapIbe_004303 [Capra ibex]|nr:hypothetical protein MJT46_001961 [Ovis ammon polii x Ovis aries]
MSWRLLEGMFEEDLGRLTPSPCQSLMASWSREAVLSLYRALLRQGRQLRYTDRDFYLASIRREFRKNQKLEDPEAREKQLEKGLVFLHSKLGGII